MSSLVGKDIDLTLYPGLLTPALVAWSTNVGGSLVKLNTCNDVLGRWVDVCRSSTFFLYSYEVAFWTQEILMSSTLSLHGQCLWLAMHVTPLYIHPTSGCPGCHCTLGWEGLGMRLRQMCSSLGVMPLWYHMMEIFKVVKFWKSICSWRCGFLSTLTWTG